MATLIPDAVLAGLLVGSTLAFMFGTFGYRNGHHRYASIGSITGFVTFAGILALTAVWWSASDRPYRVIAVPFALMGVAFCLHATRLIAARWHRSSQLVTAVTAFLVLLAPFELAPQLHVVVQEFYAAQTATLVRAFGWDAILVPTAAGNHTRLTFQSGGYLTIVRECNGVYAFAFFSSIIIAARASIQRRLAGIVYVVVLVYLVNSLRMGFVASALANDWFGPLVTNTRTLHVTYIVAEIVLGQTVILVSSILGYLGLGRWIPDLLEFVTDLSETVDGIQLGRV